MVLVEVVAEADKTAIDQVHSEVIACPAGIDAVDILHLGVDK